MEIQELLKFSVDKNASDLHLLPGSKPLVRVDGALTVAKEFEELFQPKKQSV